MSVEVGSEFVIKDPDALIEVLLGAGWRVIGPRLADGAIVYEPISCAGDMPRGVKDEQDGGHYRVVTGREGSWFDYVVGPQSWKKWLFPARQKLWSAIRNGDGFDIDTPEISWTKTVFFGVRPCEIAAIEMQDSVFDNGEFEDPGYLYRRSETLVVAVQCARSAASCFCLSMDTGPRAKAGFDIALTELGALVDDGFLVECGSEHGAEILEGLTLYKPRKEQREAALAATQNAAENQTRHMINDVAALLRDNLDHKQWDAVAERCLSCANCTMACPTCFCSDVEDATDLTGDHAERWRMWDSCFTADFSHIHGGSVRRSTRSRYRQWMTHKLSNWFDQFGTSGCVGCGRCITWCPVGIDITEEAAAIAAAPAMEKE